MLIDDVWVSAAMIPQLCALTGAHRTTVASWLKRRRLPPAVITLLRIQQHGELGEISPAWAGWVLRDDALYAPGEISRGLTPGNLQALPWRLHQLAVLEAERRAAVSRSRECDRDGRTRVPACAPAASRA